MPWPTRNRDSILPKHKSPMNMTRLIKPKILINWFIVVVVDLSDYRFKCSIPDDDFNAVDGWKNKKNKSSIKICFQWRSRAFSYDMSSFSIENTKLIEDYKLTYLCLCTCQLTLVYLINYLHYIIYALRKWNGRVFILYTGLIVCRMPKSSIDGEF